MIDFEHLCAETAKDIHAGMVLDIANTDDDARWPWGGSWWHVRVEEEPYVGSAFTNDVETTRSWVQFKVTDGMVAFDAAALPGKYRFRQVGGFIRAITI